MTTILEYKVYYLNGELFEHYFKKADKLVGEYKCWFHGKLVDHHIYDNGNIIETLLESTQEDRIRREK